MEAAAKSQMGIYRNQPGKVVQKQRYSLIINHQCYADNGWCLCIWSSYLSFLASNVTNSGAYILGSGYVSSGGVLQ